MTARILGGSEEPLDVAKRFWEMASPNLKAKALEQVQKQDAKAAEIDRI